MQRDYAHFDDSRRSEGFLLIQAALLTMILFGFTASLIIVLLGEARAVRETTDRRTAFYLAEAGLEGAKWEIGDEQDPGGDGFGNCTFTSSLGTYSVTAAELSTGVYQLDVTGTSGAASANLRSVIKTTSATTTFPYAALSMVGAYDKDKLKIKKHLNFIVDGGDTPAIRIADQELYNQFVADFGVAFTSGAMSATQLTGTVAGQAEQGTSAISYDPNYPTGLQDLGMLYQSMVTATGNLVATGSTVSAVSVVVADDSDVGYSSMPIVYGTSSSPTTIHAGSLQLSSGDTLTGHGTLIVTDELVVGSGATLDWNGNVIVLSTDDAATADLTVNGGSFNVTGNVVVLGESLVQTDGGVRHASSAMTVSAGSIATVTGSLFLGSEYDDTKDTETLLHVDPSSSLYVDGLFTMVGRKVMSQVDQSGLLDVDGMVQMGSPDVPDEYKMNLKLMTQWDGTMRLRKHDGYITAGAEAVQEFGADLQIEDEVMAVSVGGDVETVAWQPVYE